MCILVWIYLEIKVIILKIIFLPQQRNRVKVILASFPQYQIFPSS